jgi:hypothetical protein
MIAAKDQITTELKESKVELDSDRTGTIDKK